MNAIVQHTSRRYGYLLNDVLLITTVPSTSTGIMFNTVERVNIHQIFYLDQIAIADVKNFEESEESTVFEIRTADRPYYFYAESEADKKIWLEELEAAIFSILSAREGNKLGWYHETVLGTFHSAAYVNDEELVEKHIKRLEGQSLDTPDEAGMTALHWASLNGNLHVVEKLLLAGAEIDHVNGGLNSALLLAASFGHRDVVFLLLDRGADFHLRNLKDHDCLLMAVIFGSFSIQLNDIIIALHYRGVDVNRQDISGATPLHECSSRNLPISIQALVDAGADVNAKHGRNGLTPLQLACSAAKPNAETVRSLLDKGALPNWKDTMKRSAFDMILFSKQFNQSNAKNFDTKSLKGMKQTVDEVSEFVQVQLPSLAEIVRKGGRYEKECIEHLRESFQDVLNQTKEQWRLVVEPDNFASFIQNSDAEIYTPKAWTSDSASQSCMLCVDKFTYSNRRHHCRTCGILCCDPCSMKRLTLPKVTGGHSPAPSSSSGKKEQARVCDSCFNRLVFECQSWNQAVARAKKEQQRREQEFQAQQEAASKGLKTPTGKEGSFKNGKSINASTSATSGVMNETMRALEERGQRLQNTAEQSEQLREVSFFTLVFTLSIYCLSFIIYRLHQISER